MNCSHCGYYNDPDAPGVMNFPDGTQLVKCETCKHLRFNNDNIPFVFFGEELVLNKHWFFDLKLNYKEWLKKRQRLKYYLESLGVRK